MSAGETMIITTDRLTLREFIADDWQAVLAYQSQPEYLRYYPWNGRTEEQVRAFLARFLAWQSEEPRRKYQLAVTLAETGELIGCCGIRKELAESSEAELGYEIAPAQWGQGYATEAARAMLAFGFDTLRLHRVWSTCVAENVASAHVLAKLGMRLEGRLREKQCMKGRWWDTLLYAILEQEWRKQ